MSSFITKLDQEKNLKMVDSKDNLTVAVSKADIFSCKNEE